MKIEANSISEYLIKYREKYALNQTQLADLCGVSITTICNLENGKAKLSYRTRQQIAKGTNISVVELCKF